MRPTDDVLDALTQCIVAQGSIDRVVLFGSRARGDHREDSDYDLLVVVDDQPAMRREREKQLRAALGDDAPPLDLIVYSRAAFEDQRTDVGTLAYMADAEGRVLHESRPSPRPPLVREPGTNSPKSLARWIARAERDRQVMEAFVADRNMADVTVFHAHEGAEKYLKAALVRRHVMPPRTHTLTKLLAPNAQLPGQPKLRRACKLLDELFPRSRYPDEDKPELTPADARAAANAVSVIREAVLQTIRD